MGQDLDAQLAALAAEGVGSRTGSMPANTQWTARAL